MKFGKQRLFALFIGVGISILFLRTLRMILIENAINVLIIPLVILLFIEMLIDGLCILSSIYWFIKNREQNSSISLKLAAIGILLHAIRVLFYALGRIRVFLDFDIKDAYKGQHAVDIFWVYFAVVMSLLGVIGVLVVWSLRKKKIL